MPSTSPGKDVPPFVHVLPGAPAASLQSLTSFIFRHKRYIAYISGQQLNIFSVPIKLVQALTFQEELLAVASESQTGKLIVAGKSDVYVLGPVTEGWTKCWWEKSLSLQREDAGDIASCLSWGSEGEVLVGGSRCLTLFSTLPSSRTSSPAASPIDGETVEERKPLWSKAVPSGVQYAAFSPTAGLIASCGKYDRLVKIWRRLSFEEGLFDHTYLPHAGAVTHLEWRPQDEHAEERRGSGISRRHDEDCEVLYTIASDGVLRVWRTSGPHDLDILLLHTTVDLVTAIPQSPTMSKNGFIRQPRYAFIVPSDHFCAAVNAALGKHLGGKVSHALEHLKEMTSKTPDVVVTLDGHGRMSAWGLQSVGHKRRPETPTSTNDAFHIAHAEDVPIRFADGINARLHSWFEDSALHVLSHSFEGQIAWWQGDVETFFSPSSAGSEQLKLAADWTGHDHPIKNMAAVGDSVVMVSVSASDEIAFWQLDNSQHLQRTGCFQVKTSIQTKEAVLDVLPCGPTATAITLHATGLYYWDEDGSLLSQASHGLNGNKTGLHISSIASTNGFIVFDDDGYAVVSVPDLTNNDLRICSPFSLLSHAKRKHLKSGALHKLAVAGELAFSKTLRDYTVMRFLLLSTTGRLERLDLAWPGSYSGEPEDAGSATYYTDVENSSLLTANVDVAALLSADSKRLTVLDLEEGYVEHQQAFGESVRLMQCYKTEPHHSFLAVGFDESVQILAQGRYEHHHMTGTWMTIRKLPIDGLGLNITSLAWLAGGILAVGAGNGIMLSSNAITAEQLDGQVQQHIDLYTGKQSPLGLHRLGSYLRRPLPVWHPSVLTHLVRHGKPRTGIAFLKRLAERLKFWSEGETLHPMLHVDPTDAFASNHDELSDDIMRDLTEQLDEKDLPAISQQEQVRLKHVMETLAFVDEHVKGLDMCALRYLFSWKLQLLQMEETHAQPNGGQPNGISHQQQSLVPQMHWREIAFASHSTTQQPLLDILVLHYDNKLTWPIAYHLGITAWLSDKETLEQVFEALAQSSYRATNPPDPINASLYFLALHKKPTLIALWRIATWHKEQRMTTNFLKRDFSLAANRTAAKKNAYALMGKRRFEYAAAFFLLANDPNSATSLLAGQCEDVMLAIAVARLYSGDQSATVRKLLEDRLMPKARTEGDRWLMSWCHSISAEKHLAAEALVEQLDGVRTWHQDDSTTLMLYQQLRQEPSEHEYRAVLRAARILRRMGLWLLALELVSKWQFKQPVPPKASEQRASETVTNGVRHEVPSMLDSFEPSGKSSTAPPSMLDGFEAPPADDKAAREAKAAELLKNLKAKKTEVQPVISEKQPTQFKEPDANSLLDNFGF